MTNQNQPGQQNVSPGEKPGQQQGGGHTRGQQNEAPNKGKKIPRYRTRKPATPTLSYQTARALAGRFFLRAKCHCAVML